MHRLNCVDHDNRYLYASGLKGPIPDEIARLENLTNLYETTFN